ncbi:MAG: hypothetical protein Q3X95_08095, partial [Duodenibacillus sp.]|nr:hypothetical protein [Duodenibacillus sp.]
QRNEQIPEIFVHRTDRTTENLFFSSATSRRSRLTEARHEEKLLQLENPKDMPRALTNLLHPKKLYLSLTPLDTPR